MQARTSTALKIAAANLAPRADDENADAGEAVEAAREMAAEIALDQLAAEAAARAEYADGNASPAEAPATTVLISGLTETAL